MFTIMNAVGERVALMATPKQIKLTNLSAWSLAKVFGWVQAVLGLIVGAIMTISVAVGHLKEGTAFLETIGISVVTAGFAIVIFPLVMYLVGWVQGLVAGWILSVVFQESGGLRLEITEQ